MRKLYTLLKITFFGLCFFLFFSCQKNITQITSTPTFHRPDTIQTVAVVPGRFIQIDSVSFFSNNQPLLVVKDSYFNQRIQDKVSRFYSANDFKTKWLKDNMPDDLYYTMRDCIKNASFYGLQSQDYAVNQIEEKIKALYENESLTPAEISDLDIQITKMVFLFSTHMTEGKIRSTGNGKGIWIRDVKLVNDADVTAIQQVKTQDDLISAIGRLQPANEQYTKLQKALEQYLVLEKNNADGFPAIAIKEKIKPNDIQTVIPLIRRKLFLTDLKVFAIPTDSATGALDSLRYDKELVAAVKVFQARHGLEPDGIIGEKTVRFLNLSFKERADIIALNMERMRWIPERNNDNYIMVNVPEFKLRLYTKQKQEMEMNVIVGSVDKPTPIFSDALQHIVFSPTWTVPVSILKEEIIPRLKRDSSYYTQRNYLFYKNEVQIDPGTESWSSESINPYQYRVVQQPGPDNALGLVKFIMPNNMSVYLHDTPNHSLFSKSYRALSHGCVRLDEPAKFAECLLRNQKGWGVETIYKAMHASTPSTIILKNKCEVRIEYRTAWVDDNGLINFREDIYGHDKSQLQQLYTAEKSSAPLAGI